MEVISKIKTFLNPKYIFLILLLGFILRVININQSLWLDEAAQVIESTPSPLAIIDNMQAIFHPPLFHLIFHYWLIFGREEWTMRLLPVSLGIGSIYLTYKLGKALFNKEIGLIAGFLLSINPFHIYFSQEIRPYMLHALLAGLSIYLLWMCLKNGKGWWILFTLVNILNLYSSYFAIFLIAAQLIFILSFSKQNIKQFLISILIAGVLFIPWLPQIQKQLVISHGITSDLPGWKDAVATPLFKLLPLSITKFIIGQINFRPMEIYGFLAVVFSSLWAYLLYKSLQFKKEWFYIGVITSLCFVLPFIFSIFLQIASPKRLLFVLPPLTILLALGALNLKRRFYYAALGGLVLISIFNLSIYYSDTKFQREDWRAAIKYIESKSDQNTAVVFKFTGPFAPYFYYNTKEIEVFSIAESLQVTPQSLGEKFIISNSIKHIFVFQYLGALTDRYNFTEAYLQASGFEKIDTVDFNGVGLIDEYYFKGNESLVFSNK